MIKLIKDYNSKAHVLHELTVGTKVVVQNTKDKRVDEEFHPIKLGAWGYYIKRSLESMFKLFNHN